MSEIKSDNCQFLTSLSFEAFKFLNSQIFRIKLWYLPNKWEHQSIRVTIIFKDKSISHGLEMLVEYHLGLEKFVI